MRQGFSVLVADDDKDTANSLAELLSLYGFAARAAATPLDALRLAAQNPPDAVIMDIRWSGGPDGYQLTQSVRGMAGQEPLLIAATGMNGCEARSFAEGFDYHFIKPLDLDRLVQVLTDRARQVDGERSSPPA
jgi:CheY-like chemotaxis protein